MTQNSVKHDLSLITTAFDYVREGKMAMAFSDLSFFTDLTAVTFDQHNFYIFPFNNNSYEKIEHTIECEWKKYPGGWVSSLSPRKILSYLPPDIQQSSFFSGGVFSQMSQIQKDRGSIYTTEESYIATVIHEMGHTYFNKQNPHYYNKKEVTLDLLETALNLHQRKTANQHSAIPIPSFRNLSETYAFCTEYSFADAYAPQYKKQMDQSFMKQIKDAIPIEKEIDYRFQDSQLHKPHFFSYVVGKILLEQYPEDWSERLLTTKTNL